MKLNYKQVFYVLCLGLLLLAAPSLISAGDGASVYKAKCARCHGPDGKGATAAGKATKARDFCPD